MSATEIKDLIDKKIGPAEFPQVYLKFGEMVAKNFNYGVTDRNVNINENPENVVFGSYNYKSKTIKQNVINLELHGNDYNGDILV